MITTLEPTRSTDRRPRTVDGLPRSLYIETTNRCDSKCQTCVRTFLSKEPPRDLTLEELERIVDQFPVLERVVLHGVGEPLLNRELGAMVRHLKDKGAYVLFNSDAVALTAKRASELIDCGLDELRVSLDSATRATYRAIRGVDQFDRVVGNVAELRAQERRLDRERPRVSLWFVAMKVNLHELPELVRLAARLDVPEVHLQRLVTTQAGREGLGLAVDEQSMYGSLSATQERLITESVALAAELGIRFNASGMNRPLESLEPEERARPWSGCERPWTLSYVTANGNVLPCNISACTARDYPGTMLGNALEEGFAEIWNGERYQALRERFESDVAPDPCAGCGLKWSI